MFKNTSKPHYPVPASLNIRLSPLVIRCLALILALVLTLALLMIAKGPLNQLEERVGDWGWLMSSDSEPEERLVIIAIDEASLEQIGPWPWPRPVIQQLSEQLNKAGVALQAFDLVLPEEREGDHALQQTLRQNNALLAQVPLVNMYHQTGQPTSSVVIESPQGGALQPCGVVPLAQGFLANHAVFSEVAAGHIAAQVDADGSVRQQSALYCYQGQLYPSLALSSYMALTGIESLSWASEESLETTFGMLAPENVVSARPEGLLSLPLDNRGMMRISYRQNPESFIYLSAADLLTERYPPGLLENRIALVGATAFGLGDIVPTPYAGAVPGVELQARLLTSLLDQQVPYTPIYAAFLAWFAGICASLLLLLLAGRAGQAKRPMAKGLLLVSPLLLPVVMLGMHFYALTYNLWLGWLPASLFCLLASVLLFGLEYLQSRHEGQRLYANLSRYLPDSIAASIAFARHSDEPEARQQRLIVMSADLRNFSALQQQLPPEETAGLLHHFFSMAGTVIRQYQGTLYELHADSLLAVWPLDDVAGQGKGNLSDTVLVSGQACQAALELYRQLEPLFKETGADDEAPLDLAIGIAAGRVTSGSLGAAGLRTHMLLGQPVSYALCLQKMSQDLACPVVIDQSLISDPLQAEYPEMKDLGRYLLEGGRRPRRLYGLYPKGSHCRDHSLGDGAIADRASVEGKVIPLRHKGI